MKFIQLAFTILLFSTINAVFAVDEVAKDQAGEKKPPGFFERFGYPSLKIGGIAKGYYIASDVLLPESSKYDMETKPYLAYKLNLVWVHDKLGEIGLEFLGSLAGDNLKTDFLNEDEALEETGSSIVAEKLLNFHGVYNLPNNSKKLLYVDTEFQQFQTAFNVNAPLNYGDSSLSPGQKYYFTDTYTSYSLGVGVGDRNRRGFIGISYSSLEMPFFNDDTILPVTGERWSIFLQPEANREGRGRGVIRTGYRLDIGYGNFSDVEGKKPEVSGEDQIFYIGSKNYGEFSLFKNGSIGLDSAVKTMNPLNTKAKFGLGLMGGVLVAAVLFPKNATVSIAEPEAEVLPLLWNIIGFPTVQYLMSRMIDDDSFQREIYFGINFNWRF